MRNPQGMVQVAQRIQHPVLRRPVGGVGKAGKKRIALRGIGGQRGRQKPETAPVIGVFDLRQLLGNERAGAFGHGHGEPLSEAYPVPFCQRQPADRVLPAPDGVQTLQGLRLPCQLREVV